MVLLTLKLVSSFNSMKVRLKPIVVHSALNSAMFQFHEGPIKTRTNYYLCLLLSLFQFHEGPIKTPIDFAISCTSLSFNSMKVRLKLE